MSNLKSSRVTAGNYAYWTKDRDFEVIRLGKATWLLREVDFRYDEYRDYGVFRTKARCLEVLKAIVGEGDKMTYKVKVRKVSATVYEVKGGGLVFDIVRKANSIFNVYEYRDGKRSLMASYKNQRLAKSYCEYRINLIEVHKNA